MPFWLFAVDDERSGVFFGEPQGFLDFVHRGGIHIHLAELTGQIGKHRGQVLVISLRSPRHHIFDHLLPTALRSTAGDHIFDIVTGAAGLFENGLAWSVGQLRLVFDSPDYRDTGPDGENGRHPREPTIEAHEITYGIVTFAGRSARRKSGAVS